MNAVELHHITKRFGQYTANNDISVSITAGDIHAIVGENGAGKSTLMKILYGYYGADGGTIAVNGKEEKISDPAKAISLGIGMVHQHFMLIPALTVVENIILGDEPVNGLTVLSISEARSSIEHLSREHGFDLDLNEKVAHLPVSAQQKVEILKILYRKAEIIIFDEPTPVLTPQEVEKFLQHLLQLKKEGKTIILITHKLSEVFTVCDTLTILKGGKLVRTMETSETSPTEVARLMTGQEIPPVPSKITVTEKRPALTISGVMLRKNGKKNLLNNLNLTLHHGEIVGLAGVENNGQSDLVKVILGLEKAESGSLTFSNEGNDPAESRPQTIAHIPDDRIRDGMIGDFTVEENFILGIHKELRYSSKLVYSKENIAHFAEANIKLFDISLPGRKIKARLLSGGNQQKMVLARELSKQTGIIIANQPTRGLDIKAIEFVHSALIKQRNNGRAVLLISSDLAELLKISDRIAVIYEGTITAEFDTSATSDKELGLYMTGVSRQSA